ncbi:MAG: Gfo/Idh/MocA family oxidoreductase [Clostridiales bacterium]|nr:Gfo/Idh/MocA family oxidoreductase [Clostridiales bacterium]
MDKPVTAVIVGGGHRAFTYADLSLEEPQLLKIVGIADPNPVRRKKAAERYGFSAEHCYENARQLADAPKFADAVINGTMDHQHVDTAIPLLEKGYDMLLEKPFAVNEDEMSRLMRVVKEHGSKVMICHVLRYAPFYFEIKKRVLAGEIGKIINIQTSEHVSYHHISTSYVRGKWSNSETSHTSMLLAKCCHDLDIMMWMMSETEPAAVSSFGSTIQFKKENAPEGSAERCYDCKYIDSCEYSAKKLYIEHPQRWEFYVWDSLEHIENPSIDEKIELMKKSSPYGRCIYKCDNNVVDHQSVLVNFADGATGTHNMVGGSSFPSRRIHIIGTKGEIFGNLEDNAFTISKINASSEKERDVETLDLSSASSELDAHGGGDIRLVRDFVDFQRGAAPSVACTSIFDSVAGHLTVFLADRSRENNGAPQAIDIHKF